MANMFINAMTDLWNSAGTTYTAIKMNVTNSASSAASKLIQLQVGGVDMFTVDKTGNMIVAGTISGTGTNSPSVNDSASLGQIDKAWSDLFLASGGVINWATSDVTTTHSSNGLAFAGATNGYSFTGGPIVPATNDASALGTTTLGWSDAFFATGGTIHFANTDWVATHSTGILTVGTGDLRVTTAGTNAASVVTVGGTQTLTGKTMTGGAFNGTVGATTPLTGAFTTLTATGAISTSSTLTATGAISTSSTLTASGAISTSSTLTAAGAITTAGSFPESVVKFTGSTGPWGDSYVTADFAYGVRGTDWVWNDKADFSGTDVMKLTETGQLMLTKKINDDSGPVLVFYADSTSPANGNFINSINHNGRNSAAAVKTYAQTNTLIIDPTAGSEDASMYHHIMVAGTQTLRLLLYDGGVATYGTHTNSSNIWAGTDTVGVDFGLQCDPTARHFRFASGYHWTLDMPTGQVLLYTATGLKARWLTDGVFFHSHPTTYKPGGGAWADSSDARIKTVNGDYTTGLEAVLALRPVRYVYKGNDTRDVPAHTDETLKETPLAVPYPNSDHFIVAQEGREFVGFIAQETETVMPDIVSTHAGFIDGEPVADIRDIDTSRLIFALVNAVKELSAKVEALEAGS